jgi:hypothetical protein
LRKRKKVLCPSAPADVKAILLGVVQSDGSVAFIKDRIEITREFLNIAANGREPETRFRFSSACIGSACKQWANGGCSLPERLADVIPRSDATDAPLPDYVAGLNNEGRTHAASVLWSSGVTTHTPQR